MYRWEYCLSKDPLKGCLPWKAKPELKPNLQRMIKGSTESPVPNNSKLTFERHRTSKSQRSFDETPEIMYQGYVPGAVTKCVTNRIEMGAMTRVQYPSTVATLYHDRDADGSFAKNHRH